MQILIHLQARCSPLISSVQISVECKWAQISRNGGRRCKQIPLGCSFGSRRPTVKLMSICRETHCVWMMGEQLKEYFVTGLQPKGINSDFLSAAASRRALAGSGEGERDAAAASSCKQAGKGALWSWVRVRPAEVLLKPFNVRDQRERSVEIQKGRKSKERNRRKGDAPRWNITRERESDRKQLFKNTLVM